MSDLPLLRFADRGIRRLVRFLTAERGFRLTESRFNPEWRYGDLVYEVDSIVVHLQREDDVRENGAWSVRVGSGRMDRWLPRPHPAFGETRESFDARYLLAVVDGRGPEFAEKRRSLDVSKLIRRFREVVEALSPEKYERTRDAERALQAAHHAAFARGAFRHTRWDLARLWIAWFAAPLLRNRRDAVPPWVWSRQAKDLKRSDAVSDRS